MAKHQTVAKKVTPIKEDAIKNRLNKMITFRNEVIIEVNNYGYEHVLLHGTDSINPPHLMKGNDKTGEQCWTISLIPIFDCVNCGECSRLCYDIRNDCIYPAVLKARAINSALRELNPERFWQRVGEMVADSCVTQLRINVGGDLRNEDFELLHKYVALPNPRCDVLFFTKNYHGINSWLNSNGNSYADNFHPLMSGWKGMDCINTYDLPMSHVVWADGSSDKYLPEFGAYYCGGNCTKCHFKDEGCWVLKNGQHVCFLAH